MNEVTEYEKSGALPPPLGRLLMTEKLLQFIWQFQYFNQSDLLTTAGEKVEIIFQGNLNHNQGPDFTDAHVRIDNTLLAGSVELHLKASQWNDHGHQFDENYRNVILHVVLENNTLNQSMIPVLELQSRISGVLIERYKNLLGSSSFIPCAGSVSQINELVWTSWKERLLAERLTRKSKLIFQFLGENNWHWEETFWWMLARNFGATVNSDAFEAVARSLPLPTINRQNSLIHLEALLLGQANLLHHPFKEKYPKLLQREYQFLQKKYSLQPIHIPIHFLRMRPSNFPTIRLVQLAALIHHSKPLFSNILTLERLSDIKHLISITANDYWHYHYRLDEPSDFKKKTLGKEMTEQILINTFVPMIFAYGLHHKEGKFQAKAVRWLEETHAENNAITKGFAKLNLSNESAFDSQAFIELKTRYCNHRFCLECPIGNAILR